MWKRGQPGATPTTARNTSGARLDPPMPSSTTSVKPSRFTPAAKLWSRSIESAISAGESIQPSRSVMVFCTAASVLHADGSRCHRPFAARAAATLDARKALSSGPAASCSERLRRSRFPPTSSAGHRVTTSCALSIEVGYLKLEVETRNSKLESRKSQVARGFESKDVEFQQAEKERVNALGRELSPEERDAHAKRQTLELALARARGDLAAARTPAHRRMLTSAIAALEQ